MKRLVLVFAVGLVSVAAYAGQAVGQSPTTTIIPTPDLEMGSMEWVQSQNGDPAFAGFGVQGSVIIVAIVRGQELKESLPAGISSVRFVEASLAQQEFWDGKDEALTLLQETDPSVVSLSYDPLADQVSVTRRSDAEDRQVLPSARISEALIDVFGSSAHDIGHRIKFATESGVPRPIGASVLCELGEPDTVAPSHDWGFMRVLPSLVIDGEHFGTDEDWTCKSAPPDNPRSNRLVYSLMGLVALLAAAFVWVFSVKSDLERQLWVARNPKSQLPM